MASKKQEAPVEVPVQPELSGEPIVENERPLTLMNDVMIEQLLAENLAIEPLALQEELIRLPIDNQYWAERQRLAIIANGEAEINYRVTCARLNRVHRERILATNGKATESMVTAAVEEDAEYQQAYLARTKAEADLAFQKLTMDSFRMKRDALNQIAAQQRQENEKDIVIRRRSADELPGMTQG